MSAWSMESSDIPKKPGVTLVASTPSADEVLGAGEAGEFFKSAHWQVSEPLILDGGIS